MARLIVGVTTLETVIVLAAKSSEDPLTPQQEFAAFHFADPNLTAELIAAEPDIVAPVAIAWDADGRLFVAEMTDYPSGPVSGRIRLLEDRDGDGRYERAIVFAENIAFPNGVMPWNGGVLVTAAPDILFFKDNDGDGHADERRVLFTGFAEGNQQLRANGLFWGLDNWIYGANGRSDGDVRRADDPSNKKVSIRRRDFRFRPGTKQFEAISGHSQFGCAHDDWGNRFPVFNNIPIRHVVIEQRYLDHQPFLAGAETVVPISAPDDKGRVYYLAPPTLLIPQASDYFTSACGPTVYRGDALGPDYHGNFFVCEPVHNLIQRRRLVPNGATFVAERTESGKDFLASTDPWFHGVFTATGPDGCLYVVDFYRKFVEHPAWVADELKNTTPWRTGEQHGRIWRIHPKDWNPKMAKPNLSHARSSELVEHLGDVNGWWRDSAQRLLVERQDRSVVRALGKMARKSPSPPGRLRALYTLDGLGALSPDSVLAALKDSDSHVREHAIRLVEPFLVGGANAPASRTSTPKPDGVSPHQIERIKDALFGLVDDKDLRVRFQLAFTIGGLDEDAKLPALAHLAQRDAEEPWTALAVLTGVGSRPWLFWRMLGGQNPNWLNDPDQTQAVFLDKLAGLVGNAQNEGDWREAIKWFDQTNHPLFGRLVLFNGLAESARSVPSLRNLLDERFIGRGGVNELGHQAYRVATDQSASLPARVAAVRVVGRSNAKAVGRVLIELLKPEQSTDLQAAAVKALAELNDAALSASAVAGWEQYSRATRQRLVVAAPRSGALADALLTASEQGRIQLIEVDPSTRQALQRSLNPELKRRAENLFRGAISADREQVVQNFKPAVQMNGNRKHGAEIFAKTCLRCHAMQGEGARVGPDLSGIATQPRETMLMNILDPSRQVLPDFLSYTVATADGETSTGLITAESATSVTIRRPDVTDVTIQRDQIKELKADGKSLMPDGLEAGLTVQDMSDLLSFLRQPEAALLPKDK